MTKPKKDKVLRRVVKAAKVSPKRAKQTIDKLSKAKVKFI